MKKLIEFFKPQKSKWIDLAIYDLNGHYRLSQMRIQLNNNKKTFRIVHIGFINDYTIKQEMYKNILATNSDDI
jgi:hypothetical protein